MKKYGKYEKLPNDTKAKQPSGESALLQLYFTSMLSLVLCVTMFFGTSYAWFSSEITSVGNEIFIGVLDVDLQMNGASLGGSDTKVFDHTIRWAPGHTALRSLTVVNEGDLAFNYTLHFTDGTAKDTANNATNLGDIANCFEVWICSGSYSMAEGETFADMTIKEGWTRVGTLADILCGEAVFSGSMTNADVVDENGAKRKTAHTYTIALHMRENTMDEDGINGLMGSRISLNVKLTAYQMAAVQGT